MDSTKNTDRDKNESIFNLNEGISFIKEEKSNFLDKEVIRDPITTNVKEPDPVINEELQKLMAITLMQSPNQTIYVYVADENGNFSSNNYYTTSFFAKQGTKLKFAVIPDKEANEKYWIRIIQSDHQVITVTANQSNFHDWRAGILVSYPTDDKEYKNYPDEIGVASANKYDYIVVKQNIRVFATLAIDEYNEEDLKTITITSKPNEKITAIIDSQLYGDGQYIIAKNSVAEITVTPDPGYIAGSLIINSIDKKTKSLSITITENLDITCNPTKSVETELNLMWIIPQLFIGSTKTYGLGLNEIELYEGNLENNNLEDKTITTYDRNIITTTPLNMYATDKKEYVSTTNGTINSKDSSILSKTDTQFYYGINNQYNSQSIMKINRKIDGLDSIPYFVGYHKILPKSDISTVEIDLLSEEKKSIDKSYIRSFGFGYLKSKDKWYWLLELYSKSKKNIDLFDSLNFSKSLIYIYRDKTTEAVGNIIGFTYLKSYIDSNNPYVKGNDTIYILAHEAKKNELDPMYLYMNTKLGEKVYLNMGLYLNLLPVTIKQVANQTIYVICDEVRNSSNFTVPYGIDYKIEIIPNKYYSAGTANIPAKGVITNKTNYITASAAIPIMKTITIKQVANQTIYATCNGKKYSSTFTVQQGSSYSTEVVANKYYNPGAIQGAASSGILEDNITITSTAAIPIMKTVTITQIPNETIYVTCDGKKHNSSFSIHQGTTYTAEVVANANYNAGKLNVDSSGTVLDNMSITASSATPIMHTVTITQVANQTIYVTCNGTKHSSTFTVQQGTPYTIEIVPDAWYAVGKIQGASSEGTVQTDMNITASAATERPSYDLNIIVGHYPSTNPNVYGLDCTYKWGGSKDPEYHFGEISEDNIIDIFSANTNSAYLAFWGRGKPPVTFNSVSAYLYTDNGSKKYTICENFPYSSLTSAGDINSSNSNQLMSIRAIDLYNILKANDGKNVNLKLRLNK